MKTKKKEKKVQLKLLYNIYIKDLYKDRNAIAKPFHEKVLVTCNDIKNSELQKKNEDLLVVYIS